LFRGDLDPQHQISSIASLSSTTRSLREWACQSYEYGWSFSSSRFN